MSVRIAMVGAAGKMGARIISLALENPHVQVVAGVERAGSPAVGHFTGNGLVPVVGDIREILPKTDVVIDFTSADAVLKNAAIVAKHKKALVVGTTGLTPAQNFSASSLARRIPIVFSPNMSVGVNVLFDLVRKAASTLAHYDIEIIEAHHNLKKDSPSGTGMKLAEIAAEASNRSLKDFTYGRRGQVGARKKKEIGVFGVRAGDIVGDHTVMIAGPGERLELIHRAHSRDSFAAGAISAAVWAAKRRPGLYSMRDVLKI